MERESGLGPPRPRPDTPTDPDAPLRVLVADDEGLIRDALDRLLSARGHLVETASDAATALRRLHAGSFDVVLVDDKMPGGGRSVLHELARTPEFGGRAILMTGGNGVVPPSGLAADFRLVRKPFDYSVIVRAVEGRAEG